MRIWHPLTKSKKKDSRTLKSFLGQLTLFLTQNGKIISHALVKFTHPLTYTGWKDQPLTTRKQYGFINMEILIYPVWHIFLYVSCKLSGKMASVSKIFDKWGESLFVFIILWSLDFGHSWRFCAHITFPLVNFSH